MSNYFYNHKIFLMVNLIKQSENKDVIFVDDINELNSVKDLSEKKLCIIKSDFKNLHKLKSFQQNYPNLEIWLSSKEISRKNMLLANRYNIKNVIPYPFDIKIISNFFKSKERKSDNDISKEVPQWLNGMKVMIVDDNPMNVELLAETLAGTGLCISAFTNPIDASVAASKEKFDLFLLDVMMPDMSGFELAQSVKDSEVNEDTPVIFISALSDADTKIEGFNIGSYAYIEKPFDVNVVRSQIINVLKNREIQQEMQKKKEAFLAMVTHDLKSPINAEIKALEILEKNYLHSAKDIEKEIVSDVLEAGKYMKNLVDNILNKYSYENGAIILHKERHSLYSLVIECIEETKYLMQEKGLQIDFSDKTRKCMVLLDYLEIKRVIRNLLMNAVEYSPNNSEIHINLSENKNDIIFSIKNKNKGIVIENPEDLFNKFVSYANKQKCVGTGLGLYIAKKAIDAHSGMINIDVSDKDYVKFIFTLPKEV